MAVSDTSTEVQYSYPLHAILLVVLAWLFFLALIAGYSTIGIALFPMSPLVAAGGAGMLSMAHDYAKSVRKARTSHSADASQRSQASVAARE